MLLFSNPTAAEAAFRAHKEKKKKKSLSKDLLNKYGGLQHLRKTKSS